MRKLFALVMVALLAMTVALAVVGCGKKAEETPPPAEQTTTAPADTAMQSMDSTAAAPADTAAHQ